MPELDVGFGLNKDDEGDRQSFEEPRDFANRHPGVGVPNIYNYRTTRKCRLADTLADL